MLHTGANTQSGGVRNGFSRFGYQVLTLVAVIIPPTLPSRKQVNRKNASANRSAVCFIILNGNRDAAEYFCYEPRGYSSSISAACAFNLKSPISRFLKICAGVFPP